MFDFDGGVKGNTGELLMQHTSDAHGVAGAIEEVGVAESDMACPQGYLRAYISQYDLRGYCEEAPVVDRCDGAVQAGMFAAACRLSVAGQHHLAMVFKAGIAIQQW